jgi:hypothetical protein
MLDGCPMSIFGWQGLFTGLKVRSPAQGCLN